MLENKARQDQSSLFFNDLLSDDAGGSLQSQKVDPIRQEGQFELT